MIYKDNIYLRLSLPFTLLFIVATALIWLLAVTLLSHTLEQRLQAQLSHANTILAQGGFPYTPPLLSNLAHLLQADIVLLHADGSIGQTTVNTAQQALKAAIQRHFSPSSTGSTTQFTVDNEPYLASYQPILSRGDDRYTVIASVTSLHNVHQVAVEAAWWLSGGALLGVILFALVGHRITRTITQPIRRLAAMASQIAAGDRSVKTAFAEENEIGELAKALNTMTSRLAHYEQGVAEKSRYSALGQMAARLAHEIRNPLTAIKMQAQLLHESLSADQRPRSGAIIDEIKRLELIVTSTLDIGKPAQLQRSSCNLNQLLTEFVALLTPMFEHRHIRITTHLPPNPPLANLDSDRIKQVILNLLVNAQDELPQGGEIVITIEYALDQGCLTLYVEDCGPGIPPEMRDAVFNPAVSNKPSGLGLGLPLCRELIECHQGEIHVADSVLGGAKFTITLPLEIR